MKGLPTEHLVVFMLGLWGMVVLGPIVGSRGVVDNRFMVGGGMMDWLMVGSWGRGVGCWDGGQDGQGPHVNLLNSFGGAGYH